MQQLGLMQSFTYGRRKCGPVPNGAVVVEELAPIAKVLNEFPVTVDFGVEMAKLRE